MAFVDWSDQYSVNNREIDEHHRHLFSLVNELHVAILARKGRAEAEMALEWLVAHSQEHFAAEERLMQAGGYPRCQAHKEEHDRLLRQLGELERKFRQSRSGVAPDMLAFLVRDWLAGHILGMDKEYALSLAPLAHRAKQPA